jgi:putative ATP-dependent endonuclease of OLD family
MRQLNVVRAATFAEEQIDLLPKWDDDHDFPAPGVGPDLGGHRPIEALEQHGVFFSQPVDLDLMMLAANPVAYGVTPTQPDERTVVAVLGKNHMHETRLPSAVLELFDDYHSKFDLSSKPATHLTALAGLDDDELLKNLPEVLTRLLEHVRAALDGLPE